MLVAATTCTVMAVGLTVAVAMAMRTTAVPTCTAASRLVPSPHLRRPLTPSLSLLHPLLHAVQQTLQRANTRLQAVTSPLREIWSGIGEGEGGSGGELEGLEGGNAKNRSGRRGEARLRLGPFCSFTLFKSRNWSPLNLIKHGVIHKQIIL